MHTAAGKDVVAAAILTEIHTATTACNLLHERDVNTTTGKMIQPILGLVQLLVVDRLTKITDLTTIVFQHAVPCRASTHLHR